MEPSQDGLMFQFRTDWCAIMSLSSCYMQFMNRPKLTRTATKGTSLASKELLSFCFRRKGTDLLCSTCHRGLGKHQMASFGCRSPALGVLCCPRTDLFH